MAKTMKGRRTKAEIQQEFAALTEEAAADKASASSKEELAYQMKETEIRAAVSEISVEVIIRKLADLNAEISKSLGNLSEKLIGEVNLLNRVKSAIMIENEQLQKVHKIDVAATALDQLIEDYQEQKAALELEIETMRAEWAKEAKSKEEAAVEFERSLKSSRLREADEYKYNRDLERKKDQDKYEQECQFKEKQNRDKLEALEKNWQAREEALRTREAHLQELQKAVEAFPVRLRDEVEKARGEAIAHTEQRFSQEFLMVTKDRESEQRISAMKIQSLESVVENQKHQIAQLQKQLDDAKKEVKEIAEKAIEGASGARALSHINQIAMEQAKNRSSSS